jgi:hypothetical protein
MRQHIVKVGAEPVGQIVRGDRAAKPARMNRADDPIANFDPGHVVPMAATSPAPSLSGTTPSLAGPRPPPLSTISSW